MNFAALVPDDLAFMPEDSRPIVCADTKGIIAFDKDGMPLAIVVLDSWSFNSCQIHIWIDNPFVIKHGMAEEVFGYVFNECQRNLIIGVTPSDNEKALRFIKHMGFVELSRIKDGYRVGVDYVVTEIRKENCRYI